MSESPLVSIIVPVYNVKCYLDVCLKSILNQTYKNIEIVLVDDGSTDGSEKLVDKYNKKYKKIKAIHKKNGGLSSARNVGIKYASGEWLAFVDSDDYIKNNYISRLVDLALENDADIATCSFKPFTDDGSMLKKVPVWPNEIFSGKDAVDDMLKNKRPAYIWLNIFRTDLFKKNNIWFPEGHDYEDIATKIRLLFYANKIAFTNEQLYFYLIRKNSITGNKFSKKKYHDFLKAIGDAKNFLGTSKYLNYFEYYSLTNFLNQLARETFSNPDAKMAWFNTRNRLKILFNKTEFPNFRAKTVYGFSLVVSSSRLVYSALYKVVKK